ncbi:LacI family DNA-binding transcriptional regulator [Aestuariibacter sp. AA17]|uniref:LacI family DNA-binding transcriptional regulator n=1 Tax=Fluctibacter corallii TaxID=2984329 RepID=A0ABT3A9I4_9ALTE|nr:LacI family DNA-binding transcriptional regulator [Aestuariibacter sp. AA17]MCV2885342.1 LacI family DNA-binding transcriptional regulator [Aestuariibacter sp. AA17]
MKVKATSFDIAHKAGVSQSTVSRALRDSPLVNQETRDKIKQIARELNYKVDKNASNLRQQQSKTIALLLFEDPTTDDSLINPFFLTMLGSITRACAQADYDLLISFQNLSDDWHADYEDTNKADGIILLGYGDYQDYRDKLSKLVAQGTHFVRWGAEDEEFPGVSIGCDNFQGGYDVTKHLLEQGCQTLAFVGGADNHAPEFQARYQGFCKALGEPGTHNSQSYQVDAISNEPSGYQAIKTLLSKPVALDAVVCASDLIAIGVIQALDEANIRVPEDIAVVGYDNIPVSSFTSPKLTTVKQDTNLAGKTLVDNLLNLINGENVETRTLPVELIIRQSCQR